MRLASLAFALSAVSANVSAQLTVPLEIGDGGYLYVHVRVADSIDVRLLLDTGAGINTLAPSILDRLGAQAHDAGTHTGTRHNGEQITGRLWSVPSVSLGSFIRRDVVVGRFAPDNADGMLSMDYFRDVPFTLDLAAGTLTTEAPSKVRDIAAHAATIPIQLKPNGPHELDFFVRVCAGDGVAARRQCGRHASSSDSRKG